MLTHGGLLLQEHMAKAKSHDSSAINGVLDAVAASAPMQPQAVGEEAAPAASAEQAAAGDRRRFSFVQLEASPPANCEPHLFGISAGAWQGWWTCAVALEGMWGRHCAEAAGQTALCTRG